MTTKVAVGDDTDCRNKCCGGLSHNIPVAATAEEEVSNVVPFDGCLDSDVCDERCVKVAAAIECSIACRKHVEEGSVENRTLAESSRNELHIDPSCCKQPNDETVDLRHDLHRHIHSHDEAGSHCKEPCSAHFKAAMKKYADYLATARCICCSIFDSSYNALQCSSEGQKAIGFGTLNRHHLNLADCEFAADCFRTKSDSEPTSEHTHMDSTENLNRGEKGKGQMARVTKTNSSDPENADMPQRVLFDVTGMDCSGCANNLSHALRSIRGVQNVNVVFINGSAEVEMMPQVVKVEELIRHAHRTTGYKLTPFVSDTQVLDLLLHDLNVRPFEIASLRGIIGCHEISRGRYEVSYDPCVIGARDIVAAMNAQLTPPRSDRHLDGGTRRLIRVAIMTIMAFVFTVPVVALEWSKPGDLSEGTALVIELVLSTMVQAIAIPEFYRPAIASLVYNKVVEMDMLVVISITAAYGYSTIAFGLILSGTNPETSPLFETSTLLISLILLGRVLAVWARRRAVKAVSLRSLQVLKAMLIDQITGDPLEVDARLLHFGDTILIQPHTRIVTDAVVTNGTSEVDESMLTGESMPVFKSQGTSVISGTVNGDGNLIARVTRLPGGNTITDIANLVEQAQGSKPPIQYLADKVAGYFIPAICATAFFTFIAWLVVGLKIREQSVSKSIGNAIGYCIAVLAVCCPCALSLAVPMVLVCAGGVAAKGGVIIKTADVIESAFKVTDVVFDKTGTLTRPGMQLVREWMPHTARAEAKEICGLIMCLASSNKHPVSQAAAAAMKVRHTVPIEVTDVTAIPGCGIQAKWQGLIVRAGNAQWLRAEKQSEVADFATQGLTMLCVSLDDEVVAVLGFKALIRDAAIEVVHELIRRRITVHIVSGDATQAVRNVADEIGISMSNVAAASSPTEKQKYIQKLMDSGKVTLFCGDGTNDAVAIAQANVGVQIESSSDVTRATADVVLLNNLEGVINVLDVSKAAFRRIIFNFCWSAMYNVLAVLLAGGAFVRIRIPPAYAGLGEIVSVLPVIAAALTQPKIRST